MKLFGSPGSPFARKVRIVLEEKRVPHEYIVARGSAPGSVGSCGSEMLMPARSQSPKAPVNRAPARPGALPTRQGRWRRCSRS